MTVVIAAKSKDDKQAGIAADKQATGWLKVKMAGSKIIRKPNILFGFAGSFEGLAAIKQWEVPKRLHEEAANTYMDRLEASLRRHLKTEATDLKHICGILLYDARIFKVQMAEMFEVEDMIAVGSGLCTAVGSLATTRRLSPNMSLEKQLELAVEIASEHTIACGMGVEVVLQDKETVRKGAKVKARAHSFGSSA